jgi:putative aldouronate transport system substrate-binding protein
MARIHSSRKIALMLTFVLLLAMLTACGQNAPSTKVNGDTSKVTTSEPSKPSEPKISTFNVNNSPSEDPFGPMSENIVMTIGKLEDSNASYEPGESVDDNYVLRYFEETLNIDYQNAWTVLSQDAYDQRVALTLASGDMPDVMTVNQLQLRQMVNADLVADMTETLEKYASDIHRRQFASTNGISIESCTFDNKVMAVPGVMPGADGIPLLYVRGDWMEKYNLSEPKTMDDIINIAKVFKENEGTGLIAQNNIVELGNSRYGLDALFALFDSYPEMWITDANGELTYGSITPQTKEALGFIRGLVEDGVLEENFVVWNIDQCDEMATSGKAGIFFSPWWYYNWPLSDMIKADPNISWNVYAVPLNDKGVYNTHMMPPTRYYAVTRKGYEHLDAVVKTLNLSIMTGSLRWEIPLPQPQAFRSWQMAPITLLQCEYDEKEVKARNTIAAFNGQKPLDELVAEELSWLEKYKYVNEHGLHKALLDNMADGYNYTIGANAIAKVEDAGLLNRVFAATYDKSKSMDTKWATLQKLEDELFLQIIVGDKGLDEFDTFVKQWKSLGGDDITAELKAMMH